MGIFYSAAKKYALHGDQDKARRSHILAIAAAAGAHGLFDLIAEYAKSPLGVVLFVAYVIGIVLCVAVGILGRRFGL